MSSAAKNAREATARQRLLGAALIGLAAGAIAAWFAPWQLALLCGFDVGAIAHLVLVWRELPLDDAGATRAIATREDETRGSAAVALLTASTAALLAVVVGLAKATQVDGAERGALTVAAIVAVVSGWLTVQTVYVLHYAHQYYGDPEGGVDFNGDEPPDYGDFAYLAFTIGMTYQVSDTNISSRAIRRLVTRQALLSFVFGTVIIATTINLLAGTIS